MSNEWVERARVAREFSKTGSEDSYFKEYGPNQDYFRNVAEHHINAGLDKRSIATGEDFENVRYEVFVSPLDGFAEMLYASASSIHIWEDLLRPIGALGPEQKPLQVLTHDEVATDRRTQSMADGTCHYTFINESDLFRLENFYFNSEHVQQFGEIPYSAIDIQDIYSGAKDGFFDLVKLNSRHIMSVDNKLLGKYMDAVKLGGVIFINEMSGFTKLYDDSLKIHQNIYYDVSKYITSRDDFLSYHLPYQLGMVVARRVN